MNDLDIFGLNTRRNVWTWLGIGFLFACIICAIVRDWEALWQ